MIGGDRIAAVEIEEESGLRQENGQVFEHLQKQGKDKNTVVMRRVKRKRRYLVEEAGKRGGSVERQLLQRDGKKGKE